jgi:fructose-1,6-bisphosphatase/inositol monophosphatase family enzyme
MIRRLLEPIQALHRRIRDDVVSATERAALDRLSDVHADDEGDTIYAIDKVAEDVLVGEVDRTIARVFGGVILVAEGLHGGRVVLPEGTPGSAAKWLVIVDPIDGTRGLMYQKRPAWILTGVAPICEQGLSLADVVLAVQTEIPLVKQHLSDELWAMAGHGATGTRVNRLTGERQPLPLRPSPETTLAHGFATIARFFPGVRADLAALDDELAETLLGPPVAGKAQFFEDQYICTGGQLYELIVGHDRFVADLRSVVQRTGHTALGTALGTVHRAHGTAGRALCCHPYDLCTELIARECGVVVTDERGRPLSAPLNVEADVSWIGYANPALRSAIEPVLAAKLRARGWVA